MKKAKYMEIIAQVTEQEEMLRFDHFTNKDAWELGKLYVEKISNEGINMAVAIRKVNGNTVFSYFTDGTNLCNENWMRRKFNTVILNEMSSFKQWAIHDMKGRSAEDIGLTTKDYALVGGGFPIKLKNGEMVAVVLASNLPHEKDHRFIVEGLADFLNVEGVPQISFDKE